MVDCGTLLDGHATRWCGHRERPSKPNIVLLLPDDVGWQDVKCYDIDEPSPMEPQLRCAREEGGDVLAGLFACAGVFPIALHHRLRFGDSRRLHALLSESDRREPLSGQLSPPIWQRRNSFSIAPTIGAMPVVGLP